MKHGGLPSRRARARAIVRVDQPLFLITQAQRSGGTLLLRLLDGHPECHVTPFQLRGVDEVAKRHLSDAAEAWEALYDPKLADRYERGHRQRKHDVLHDEDVFPFELEPELQREIYDACAGRVEPPDTRQLLDCWFTSYFNAWLDYGNLRSEPKRWVIGFEPGIGRSVRRRTAIRDLYPDGKVLAIVRDPWSWYASARRWEGRWSDRERALDHWCAVASGTLKWKKQGTGTGLRLLSFEDLLTRTEEILRGLAAWLGIEFLPNLLVPTFNGQPIRANTSFADVETEVSTRPLERARQELDADDVAYIEARAGLLYSRLLERTRKKWPTAS